MAGLSPVQQIIKVGDVYAHHWLKYSMANLKQKSEGPWAPNRHFTTYYVELDPDIYVKFLYTGRCGDIFYYGCVEKKGSIDSYIRYREHR